MNIIDPEGRVIATLRWSSGQSLTEARTSLTLKPETIYSIELWVRGSPELRVGDEVEVEIVILVGE
jgi:hypothetical protein